LELEESKRRERNSVLNNSGNDHDGVVGSGGSNAKVVPDEESDDEIDLHGAIDCFLDWNQATKGSTSPSTSTSTSTLQEESSKTGAAAAAAKMLQEKETGFLIVGSVNYPSSHMIDFDNQGDTFEEFRKNFGRSNDENEK
jgi:hypothetical protein